VDDVLHAARSALGERTAWLVGGAVRDRLLARPTEDLDVVIDGDPAESARVLARSCGPAACFALSEEFGAWRVVARDGSWQIDVEGLRGGSLEEDLRLRDFTVNAVAEPLQGGAPIDPLGGLGDIEARRLRMVAPRAFTDDPLRVLRMVRIAVELSLEPEPQTLRSAAAAAHLLGSVSAERVFMELRRILDAPAALRGLALMGEVGATAVVLPELEALHGIQQSRFHHRDVHDHTLEVLERTIALQEDPAGLLGVGSGALLAAEVRTLLAEPLADGLTRGSALRWGALLAETGMRAEGECLPASVDAAKPATRAVREDGRVTFFGHDAAGSELAREVLGRLRASERLQTHVAALVRHHLRLGFLVHEPQPLARATVFDYLRACEPVEVDVTLLSVADRLATRGDRSAEAIEAHLVLARAMLADALRWRAQGGAPRALWRGDDLARELGLQLGPRVGELLEDLARAQYAGTVQSRAQALDFARSLL
jgi:poly(A) polymerase